MSAVGTMLYKAGSAELAAWQEETKWELLWRELPGIEPRLVKLLSGCLKKSQGEKVKRTLKYFRTHSERLCYARRLGECRSIGSGQVKGACKNMIGRRLKQTGVKWRIRP